MIDFENINYLASGNERQKKAYAVLKAEKIFEILREYTPILAGTIPIDIDLPESDLDIICSCIDHDTFCECIRINFSQCANFTIKNKLQNNVFSSIANFDLLGFKIEIFGQNIPTKEQNAYKHLLIENQLLEENGSDFRNEIRKLKMQGIKTEPAFAKLLGINGDPYVELLKLGNNAQVKIREIKTSELAFLDEMLYQAIYVADGTVLPKTIIEEPELSRYIENFGLKDDFCLVAEYRKKLIGAIWIRIFTKEKPGYGFVDAKTPEMSMATLKGFRGNGIGRVLLQALIEKLTNSKYEKLSLSVDKENYAYQFYQKFGFYTYQETNKSVTMLKELN